MTLASQITALSQRVAQEIKAVRAEGSAAYLGIAAKAADSELLDGVDSTGYALAPQASGERAVTGRRYARLFLFGGL